MLTNGVQHTASCGSQLRIALLDSHLTERRGKTLAANMLTKQGALWVDRLPTC